MPCNGVRISAHHGQKTALGARRGLGCVPRLGQRHHLGALVHDCRLQPCDQRRALMLERHLPQQVRPQLFQRDKDGSDLVGLGPDLRRLVVSPSASAMVASVASVSGRSTRFANSQNVAATNDVMIARITTKPPSRFFARRVSLHSA
jgi:hypothetical protein